MGGHRTPSEATGCGEACTRAVDSPESGGRWRKYHYSVLRYMPKASMHDEQVNIGIILADRDTGMIHRRLIAKEDIARRNAEGLLPCPAIGSLDAAACGHLDGSGNPVAAVERLHGRHGTGGDMLRVPKPKYLHLTALDHEGAAEWLYETILARSRELSEELRKAATSGVEHPSRGEYWFSSIQYVPDAIRDEAVNVGIILADKTSHRTIVRYVHGEDREELGRGRFVALEHIHPYERTSSVDDIDGYMRGIAEPDLSCVQCTAEREASGRSPEGVVDRLYTRLVAHAPHHDGGRLLPGPSRHQRPA